MRGGGIAGTDRAMALVDVAKAAYRPAGIPAALGLGLEGEGAWGLTIPLHDGRFGPAGFFWILIMRNSRALCQSDPA